MEVVDGGGPRWKNSSVAERWTKERRIEHTRQILLDAAEEVFARKGLTGAALEEIADAAGFTRGAIYSQFGAKEKFGIHDIVVARPPRFRSTKSY